MLPIFGWFRRIRVDESGATALEFAIVASAFIIVSMGVIEFGRSLQVRNEMAYAMDHGARTVLMDANATQKNIEDAIKARFNSYNKEKLKITAADENVACQQDGKSGTMASRAVTISYPFDIFVPGFAGTLEMTLERSVPKGQCVV
jgi:Flp pilus assembly protein TadG